MRPRYIRPLLTSASLAQRRDRAAPAGQEWPHARLILAFLEECDEGRIYVYGLRLLAFLLILVAIIDKNRSHTSAPAEPEHNGRPRDNRPRHQQSPLIRSHRGPPFSGCEGARSPVRTAAGSVHRLFTPPWNDCSWRQQTNGRAGEMRDGRMRRARATAAALGIFALAGIALVPASAMAKPDQADGVQVFTRDVFEIVGSTLRNPTDATSPDASLFNNSGVNLEMTWGDWQRATAQSRATEHGAAGTARTDVRLSLTGLRPGGVYSVFYGTLGPDSENPLCPGVERTLALPAVKPAADAPDASSFIADSSGTADFRGSVDGHLLDATQVFFSIVYHSNGQTYGPLPNAGEFLTQGSNCRSSFGEDAMRQLIVLQKL